MNSRKRRYRLANPGKIREYARRRWAGGRARINAIKLERGCADCGYAAHPAALEFDHLPGVGKVQNIAAMPCNSWAAIEAEIAKCEVVCANCHRIRTAERGWTRNLREVPFMEAIPSLFDEEAS